MLYDELCSYIICITRMNNQGEFASFKQLLKQIYTAHSTKVKELENQIKVLKDELAEKERDRKSSSFSECKRCIELEEAFKSCKKALYDQSKMFENFGQKFSIFNSPGIEHQDLKNTDISPDTSSEKVKNSKRTISDVTNSDKNEMSLMMSLGENTITNINVNNVEKKSVLSINKNVLKKVMQNDKNPESLDVYTVTFPQHLQYASSTAKFESMILAPDSLDTTPDNKILCKKKNGDIYSKDCKNKTAFESDEGKIFKEPEKLPHENKGSGKRLSSEPLTEDRVKRCNTSKSVAGIKRVESDHKFTNNDTKSCSIIPPKIIVTDEIPDICKQANQRSTIKDINAQNNHIVKKRNILVDLVESNSNNNNMQNNLKNLNNKKNKCTLNETSPSLLHSNAHPPKIIDLDLVENDNDDFQEQVSNMKSIQNEDLWDACDKKKSKKHRTFKNIKSTSKFKMTLGAPPLNYKKTSYKQTKLSKTLFKPKSNNSIEKSLEEISSPQNADVLGNNDNLVNECIEEDLYPADPQDHFQTSTPCDGMKSPTSVDIDATFIPENFHVETRSCSTSNVKKNAVGKSHLKNGGLLSNISFPEELQFSTHYHNLNINENEDSNSKENMNSFDRLPLSEEPAFKYKNDVVRKKDERRQLNGFDCKECEKYYSELGLSDKEKKERMKKCSRHRGKFTPPATPEHFWELEFPDTQECKARGYMNETQKVKLNNICKI